LDPFIGAHGEGTSDEFATSTRSGHHTDPPGSSDHARVNRREEVKLAPFLAENIELTEGERR
jgi:hypothetical protein